MSETAHYADDGLDALPVGATIGGYAIRRLIGHGGFGITYEAHNRVTGKGVAIKEFFPSSMVRRDGNSRLTFSKLNEETITWALRKFEETTTTLCGLEHPNIVKVYDYVPTNGTGYMIMELLDGETLKDWLKARPQPPRLDELRPLVDPVMEALCYVHGCGLIHRDIAPDNILITREGRPVLIDFGSVSRDLSDARQKAMSGTVGVAKRYYTAPEQMRAKARPTPEADVYSMGAVLYRALCGSEPADGQERVDALFHGNEADPYNPLMDRLPTGCPARAAQAIDKSLALRPEGRIHTMADLRSELGALPPAVIPGPPPLPVVPGPPPPPPPLPVVVDQSPPGGLGKWIAGGAVALALLAAVLGVAVFKGRSGGGGGDVNRSQIDLGDQQARNAANAAADLARRQQTELDDREARLRQQQSDFDRQQQGFAQQQADLERQRQLDDAQRQAAAQAEQARQAQQAEAERQAEQARQAQQAEAEQARQDAAQPVAPSFNCDYAKLSVEKAICADPVLARADNEMAALYQEKRARLSGSARATFLSVSRRWLQNRNTRCNGLSNRDMRTCLLEAYAQQIEYLKS